MSQAQIVAKEQGVFALTGHLNFDSVANLAKQGCLAFKAHTQLAIDLSQVSYSDSSGLALLAEWTRFAKRNDKQIGFRNMPAQMHAIAKVTGLDKLLPITES